MCDAARLVPGQRVLDVACGTGVLARAAAERVGPAGHVVGADVNAGMLAWVQINIKSWTLADLIDDAQLAQLLAATRTECQRFVQIDGSVAFRAPAHIVTAVKA